MTNHKIEAVILYCSNDHKFFEKCIGNLLKIGIKCNVVTFSHFFAGEPENQLILNNTIGRYVSHPNFKYRRIDITQGKSALFWEAWGRAYATHEMVGNNCEYILYIDPDEIVDFRLMKLWLDTNVYKKYKGIKLRQYTYSLSPRYRLNVKAHNTVMCRKDYAQSLPFTVDARLQYFNNSNKWSRWLAKLGLNKNFYIYNGRPFIHHYTSVRTYEEMVTKFTNWSHNSDRDDWLDVLEKNHKIINNRIYGHKFKIVKNKFNLEYD